jgi:hypothetical protein
MSAINRFRFYRYRLRLGLWWSVLRSLSLV